MSDTGLETNAELENTIKCKNCASNLKYKPGTSSLVCEYCQTKNEIEIGNTEIIENDYHKHLSESNSGSSIQEITTCKCSNCGASTTQPTNVSSFSCPYCDTPLIAQNSEKSAIIKPKYLLPFKIDKKSAKDKFIAWANSLWFAPTKLKEYAAHSAEKLNGVYMPYWTYDSDTISNYSGERGTYYYVTETYKDSNGKTQTRSVRHTSWSSTSGTVQNNFDDILVCASNSLPHKLTVSLEPWDLNQLVDYDKAFISGFLTETYQTPLEAGFESAKEIMLSGIKQSVLSDIGGDDQRITNIDAQYNNITFKHILLPLWISAYRYNNKTYRFTINARTGEVQGERPYSAAKIAILIISVIVVIAGILYFSKNS